jgi:hypothetical protein
MHACVHVYVCVHLGFPHRSETIPEAQKAGGSVKWDDVRSFDQENESP